MEKGQFVRTFQDFLDVSSYMKSLEFLATLPTPRLLAYYKKHRVHLLEWKYDNDTNQSDWEKDQDAYFVAIKEMLDNREHVVK